MSDPTRSPDSNTAVRDLLERVMGEARDLRVTVLQDNVQRRKEIRRLLYAGIVVTVLLLGLVVIAVQNRRINGQNAELIRRNEQVSQQIADCTTAGGHCYEDGRKRTAQVVRDIAIMNIYIHMCGGRSRWQATDVEVEQCVAEKMAERAGG